MSWVDNGAELEFDAAPFRALVWQPELGRWMWRVTIQGRVVAAGGAASLEEAKKGAIDEVQHRAQRVIDTCRHWRKDAANGWE